MQQQCTVNRALVASAAMAEPMREDEEEEDEEEGVGEGMGKSSSSTKDLAPKQSPTLQATVSAAPKFWAAGLSVYIARQGPPASLRA